MTRKKQRDIVTDEDPGDAQVVTEQGAESGPVAVTSSYEPDPNEPEPEVKAADEEQTQQDHMDQLREDGPTLEEYVAAGYPAESYPPTGYKVRVVVKAETPEEKQMRIARHRMLRGQRVHGFHQQGHISRKLVALLFAIGLMWGATPAQAADGSKGLNLMPATTITTAVSATALTSQVAVSGTNYLVCEAVFVYGSGGTTAKAFVQTTVDGSVTWVDIMSFAFTTATASKVSSVVSTTALTAGTTPSDGSLADNTILSGFLGDVYRVKYVTTGTYAAATTLKVGCVSKQ